MTPTACHESPPQPAHRTLSTMAVCRRLRGVVLVLTPPASAFSCGGCGATASGIVFRPVGAPTWAMTAARGRSEGGSEWATRYDAMRCDAIVYEVDGESSVCAANRLECDLSPQRATSVDRTPVRSASTHTLAHHMRPCHATATRRASQRRWRQEGMHASERNEGHFGSIHTQGASIRHEFATQPRHRYTQRLVDRVSLNCPICCCC
jgi:hypothetical protein